MKMSGLSGSCQVPDNMKANKNAMCRAPCQVCHTFIKK